VLLGAYLSNFHLLNVNTFKLEFGKILSEEEQKEN
jgi:hypothetical protein